MRHTFPNSTLGEATAATGTPVGRAITTCGFEPLRLPSLKVSLVPASSAIHVVIILDST